MIDFDNITIKQAIAYYREAAVKRHENVSGHGFPWQAEAVKHLSIAHSLGMTGAVALLAVPNLGTLWLLAPIILFFGGLVLVLIGMRYAAAGYFDRASKITSLISNVDKLNVPGNEHAALKYAMQNIRSDPKDGQEKLDLGLYLAYSSGASLILGAISLVAIIVRHGI